MNLLTIIVFVVASWIIYSLLESYTNLSKKYRKLLQECKGNTDKYNNDYSTTINGNEYILPDSVYGSGIKNTLLSSLKKMINTA